MDPQDVTLLVVGGGPAGHAAATAYREHGGTGPVLLVSADDRPPYDRPPLSKDFLRGESEEDGLLLDPDAYGEADIDVRVGTSVESLDAAARLATLADGTVVRYVTCVLATGSAPQPLPVDGGDDAAVLLLRSAAQAVALRAAAEGAGSAVVVGSGFIGCEAAVSLARRGVSVTLVAQEQVPQEERLGAEVGRRLLAWLEAEGVRVLGGQEVSGVERDGSSHRLLLADGTVVTGDLVLVAAGVRQLGSLAEDAGAAVEDGRVVVDAGMRTDVPGLLAAGDVAFALNASAGRHLAVEHWGEALAMGEVAGVTAAGGEAQWDAVPGFWSEIGDRTLKQSAWGDGWDQVSVQDHPGGGFTARYGRDGVLVGVLTHDADDDYDAGGESVRAGEAFA